jgi:predicted Rossmann fold nucleotide-binding protein DprA/Smf involved in DNA uptake
VALGLRPAGRRGRAELRPAPDPADGAVLEAVGWQPTTLDQVALRTGLELAALARALDRLREAGWISQRGGWYERVAGGVA